MADRHPNQDMVTLRRDIEALIERARAEGYGEVGYFLGVALEALASEMENGVSSSGNDDIDDGDLTEAG